jgi:hypothetical protein
MQACLVQPGIARPFVMPDQGADLAAHGVDLVFALY